jgi:energy-converting hydrogenase Eha subunit A
MKQKDIAVLVGIGLIAAIISAIISGSIFNSPKQHVKAPSVTAISSTFPDVKNDSEYKKFFNDKAIDPTQLIKIGASQNQQPFSSDTH